MQDPPKPTTFEAHRDDFITRLLLTPATLKIQLFDLAAFEIYLQDIDELLRELGIRRSFEIATYRKGQRQIQELGSLNLRNQQLVNSLIVQNEVIRNYDQITDRLTRENRQLQESINRLLQASRSTEAEERVELIQPHPQQYPSPMLQTTTTINSERCHTRIKVLQSVVKGEFVKFVSKCPVKKSLRYVLDLKRLTYKGLVVGVASPVIFQPRMINHNEILCYSFVTKRLYHQNRNEERLFENWKWWGNRVVLQIDLQNKKIAWLLNDTTICDSGIPSAMLSQQLYLFIGLSHRNDEVCLSLEQQDQQ